MASTDRFADSPTADARWNWLLTAGSAAALIVSALLLVGLVGVLLAGPQTTPSAGALTSVLNNWLVVLFKLNAGSSGVNPGSLGVLHPVDLLLMVLMGAVFLALAAALRRTSTVWSLVAAALPFLGMPVLLITGTAGRSGLLVGGLIISAVMARSRLFSKVSATAGLLAGALLFFAGDLGTTIFSSSIVIAVLIGLGYVLWVVWFLLVAGRLFWLGRGRPGGPATP